MLPCSTKITVLVSEHLRKDYLKSSMQYFQEEQNANSSANYDVELLHCSEAHSDMTAELAEGCRAPSQEITGVDSVTLKWCTPKSSSNSGM